ncbi:MAG TPA: hypothetical protein VII06_28800 [Chloroflexota bacterium]|jgi:hypothetical protein
MTEYLPWLVLALLGGFHGVNPGMGWLFAVALGLQERSRAAVLRAFGPIALGHAASVALVVALVGAAQVWLAPGALRILGGSGLMAFGLYKLFAPMSHPRWVGMRVGARDLMTWSFLMATAHGAGLMLLPVLLDIPIAAAYAEHADAGHALMMTTPGVLTWPELAAIGVHTAAMYVVMAAIALVVFEKLGVAILRRAWFNLDRVWAGGLIAAGMGSLIFF